MEQNNKIIHHNHLFWSNKQQNVQVLLWFLWLCFPGVEALLGNVAQLQEGVHLRKVKHRKLTGKSRILGTLHLFIVVDYDSFTANLHLTVTFKRPPKNCKTYKEHGKNKTIVKSQFYQKQFLLGQWLPTFWIRNPLLFLDMTCRHKKLTVC